MVFLYISALYMKVSDGKEYFTAQPRKYGVLGNMNFWKQVDLRKGTKVGTLYEILEYQPFAFVHCFPW